MAIANEKIKVTVTHTANLGNYENLKIEVTETRFATLEQAKEVREILTTELISYTLKKGKQVKKSKKSFLNRE